MYALFYYFKIFVVICLFTALSNFVINNKIIKASRIDSSVYGIW